MNNKYLLSFFLCFMIPACLFSQDGDFQKVQGIWLLVKKPESTNNTVSVTINNGSKGLSFEYVLDGSADFIDEYYLGFQESNFYDVDSISVKSLKDRGGYFTIIMKKSINKRGWALKPDFLTPDILQLDEKTMWINFGNVSMYERVDWLPSDALRQLYRREKRDHRNYIKEYLNEVVEETKSECAVHSKPGVVTKIFLPKGKLVYIREIKGNWRKIEFEKDESIHQGWIEKKYLK